MYNKRQFMKSNNKKVMHKVGKQWETISIALLMTLGVIGIATHTANADTNTQNSTPNQRITNTYNESDTSLTKASNSTNIGNINHKANALHNQILSHNIIDNKQTAKIPQATDTINYTYNNKILGSHQFTGNAWSTGAKNIAFKLSEKQQNISNGFKPLGMPSNYKLANSDQWIAYDGQAHNVAVNPDQATATVNYICNNRILGSHNFTGNAWSTGAKNIAFKLSERQQNITNGFKPLGMPSGYKLANSDQWIAYTNGIHNVNITPTSSTNVILGNANGLNYKYIPKTSTIEFTDGILSWGAKSRNSRYSGGSFFKYGQSPYLKNVRHIKFDNNVNTSHVTSMFDMFAYNPYVQSIDLGNNFTTKQVNDMESMFHGDTSLTSLNLGPNFNTQNVKQMGWMFAYCNNLRSINLGKHFNTNNVSDMEWMFADCDLHELNLPNNFDPQNVKNFAWMFIGNHNLTSLNLGQNFDTSSGTNMSSMFSDDNSLSTLDLGQKFYTNNVSDMQHMFDSDYSLKNLHFGNHFNTSNVNNMYDMFIKDNNLHLELPDKFDTRKAFHNPTTIDDANQRNDGNGLANMFLNTNLKYFKINSTNTILNKEANLPEIWYNNNNYVANLTDGKSHLGTWHRL